MKNYLYLLPFKADNLFKIGISSNNLNRILHHDSTYGIDIKESYIVEADSPVIKFLELELLCLFDECKIEKYKNKDGYTEIRNKKHLKEALELISSKPDKLGIRIKKLDKLTTLSSKIKKPTRKKIYSFNNELWQKNVDNLLNNISKLTPYTIEITCKEELDSINYNLIAKGVKLSFEDLDKLFLTFYVKTKKGSSWSAFGSSGYTTDLESEHEISFRFIYYKEEEHYIFYKEALDKVKRFFEKEINKIRPFTTMEDYCI